MRKWLSLLCVVLMAFSVLTGCSGQLAEIALVTNGATVEDSGYNQAAWEGIVKYSEEMGISHQNIVPDEQSEQSYSQAIETAIERGAKVVVCSGEVFSPLVAGAANNHSDIGFIVVDCNLTDIPENLECITYAQEQIGFLAGYAAVKEGYTRLGYLGGDGDESAIKYGYGFVQGAEYAAVQNGMESGAVSITYAYTQTGEQTQETEETAASWYANGTQVIFAGTPDLTSSTIAAAEQAGTKVIGVDVDQSAVSDTVIVSAVKNVSNTVYTAIKSFYDESFPGGQKLVLDAASGGVSLTMESSRLSKLTQKDYDNLYAALANNTGNITSNIINTPSQDGSVAGSNIPLNCVTVNQVATGT